LLEEFSWDRNITASLWQQAWSLRYKFPGKLLESYEQDNEEEWSTEKL